MRTSSAFDRMMSDTTLGFKSLKSIEKSFSSVKKLTENYPQRSRVVIIGMGGSCLGARALVEATIPSTERRRISFLDNIDGKSFGQFLQEFDNPQDTTWVVASKSGKSIETLTLYDHCSQYYQKECGFDIAQNTIVVTETKTSPLYDFSQKVGCPQLEIPENIGGRYSAFTPVGLLPLSLLCLDPGQALEGCRWGLENLDLVEQLASELVASLSLSEYSFYVFAYSNRFTGFNLWLQQLWSESLAKSVTRQGEPGPAVSTMVLCRGVSDQHSILQQIVEGREKKFICFFREDSAETHNQVLEKSHFNNEILIGKTLGDLMGAEANATRDTLLDKGIRSLTLKTGDLDLKEVSALMMVWMLTVATVGEALDVNAFNQPGVESGKRLARRVLKASD